MEDKKKKYLKPIAELIDFNNDDIITLSGAPNGGEAGEGDNTEGFGPFPLS